MQQIIFNLHECIEKKWAVLLLSYISKDNWVIMQERWQEADPEFYCSIIPQMQVNSDILFKCVNIILSVLLFLIS